jgi:hypothetical protein
MEDHLLNVSVSQSSRLHLQIQVAWMHEQLSQILESYPGATVLVRPVTLMNDSLYNQLSRQIMHWDPRPMSIDSRSSDLDKEFEKLEIDCCESMPVDESSTIDVMNFLGLISNCIEPLGDTIGSNYPTNLFTTLWWSIVEKITDE